MLRDTVQRTFEALAQNGGRRGQVFSTPAAVRAGPFALPIRPASPTSTGVANAGRVVTKEELLKAVWPDSFVEESNLTQHVFRLRKALRPRVSIFGPR
jgi:hypothetical protein